MCGRYSLRFVSALLAAIALISDGRAVGQSLTDGDTLVTNGVSYRLHGIDAPELSQTCAGWPAGRLATSALQRLISGRTINCQGLDRDRYGRVIGRCWAAGTDVGAEMVRKGWAWAYRKYSLDCLDHEEQAKAEKLGIHAHPCVPAWEYRASSKRYRRRRRPRSRSNSANVRSTEGYGWSKVGQEDLTDQAVSTRNDSCARLRRLCAPPLKLNLDTGRAKAPLTQRLADTVEISDFLCRLRARTMMPQGIAGQQHGACTPISFLLLILGIVAQQKQP